MCVWEEGEGGGGALFPLTAHATLHSLVCYLDGRTACLAPTCRPNVGVVVDDKRKDRREEEAWRG